MKRSRFLRLSALTLTLIIAMTALTSCLESFKLVDGNLLDEKTGITYIGAPICFEPAVLAAEPFAKCSKLKIELYEIEGQAREEWISEPYEGIGGVWYAEGIELPTLESFDANLMYICVEKSITVALGTVSEQEDIDAIISAFVDGEPCAIVQSGESYKLKFASDKYAGIYYNLIYVEGDDGENYIYDRTTQTCVNVGDVLLEYLPR